jgi:hypothetical protein
MEENHQEINRDPDNSILPTGIRFIRGVYWFFIAGGLLMLTSMVTGLESADKVSLAETTFGLTINTLILHGIKKRKHWLVSLIIFYSTWTLLSNFLHVIGETATTTPMFAQKIGSFLFALFAIYQIHIFTRKETKLYFSEKGQTIY